MILAQLREKALAEWAQVEVQVQVQAQIQVRALPSLQEQIALQALDLQIC
jgi:hypothetical protein